MTSIQLRGVRQNNLKNIDIDIPLGSFTVVCGPSGSGKSSLAFETLYAEGQRRYIESLSNYARQFVGKAPKPDLDSITNIPPAISIEQKNAVKTSRSTVGTTTEVLDYLRLLFEKLGDTRCPTYGFEIKGESPSEAIDRLLKDMPNKRVFFLAPVLEKNRLAQGKDLLKLLLQEGYIRIWIPPKVKATPVTSGTRFIPCVTIETSVANSLLKSELKVEQLDPSEPENKVKTRAKAKVDAKVSAKISANESSKISPKNSSQSSEGEMIEITPTTKISSLPKGDFYVVVDRAVAREEDRGRLLDSMAQAYHVTLKLNQGLPGARAMVRSTEGDVLKVSEDASCAICGFSFPQMSSQLFSFNNPLGACPTCNGFGNVMDLDEEKIVPNPKLSLAQGALHPFTMPSAGQDRKLLRTFCSRNTIPYDQPWENLTKDQQKQVWDGDDKFFGVKGLFEYLETKKYKMHVRVFLSRYKSGFPCNTCHGSRLRPDIELIKFRDKTITQLSALTIRDLYTFFEELKLTEYEYELGGEVFLQIRSRLKFLKGVGVDYISMNRPTKTLSGGEYQRLNLAKQLGMGLSQTLYVLDEPTVGLHPRDNDRLIQVLKELRDLGNTLVVVEHDRDVIENATHLIEMGPGSGYLGGEVMFAGEIKDFYKSKDSITLPYLIDNNRGLPASPPRPVDINSNKYKITMKGCRGHNLNNLTVSFPLNRFVTVTGVSGSGKSTLVSRTLYSALARKLGIDFPPVQEFDSIEGAENVKDLILIDQGPIGRTARSSPVTFLKIFDSIRDIMAGTQEAKDRGYTAGTFSLNVDGGRCAVCKGLGFETIDMLFMDDVQVPCDACEGKRYRDEILEITYQGKNVNEILKMTVNESMEFFISFPKIRKPLSMLKSVGLEYLQLGQTASSLSGGESQRLKIARELLRTQQKNTLYIMDEPTTGLHFREIDLLMKVLNQLVDAGGSVILIEHNLEVIARSDYIIDIGPEAGEMGGDLVAQGSPADIIAAKNSRTGEYLKAYFNGQARPARERQPAEVTHV